MAILAHQDKFAGRRCRHNRERSGVLDDVDPVFGAVGITNPVDSNAKDPALKDALRIDDVRQSLHRHRLGGTATAALVALHRA